MATAAAATAAVRAKVVTREGATVVLAGMEAMVVAVMGSEMVEAEMAVAQVEVPVVAVTVVARVATVEEGKGVVMVAVVQAAVLAKVLKAAAVMVEQRVVQRVDPKEAEEAVGACGEEVGATVEKLVVTSEEVGRAAMVA